MAGNIKIIPAKENYKRVPLRLILDKTVDPLTLGLYCKAISIGEKWQLNIKGFAKAMEVSQDKVRKAFALLEAKGYLRRVRSRDEAGRLNGWDYEIGSEPLTDIAKTPTSENTDVGKHRRRENDTQYIDNISENIDIYPDKQIHKERELAPVSGDRNLKKSSFVKPTLDEVKAYCDERLNNIDPQQFIDFYESNGWRVGSNPMKDWKAAIRTWEARRKNEPKKPSTPSPSSQKRYQSPLESAMRAYDRYFGTDLHKQHYGND